MIPIVAACFAAALLGWIVRGVFFGYPAAALADSVLSAKEQAVFGACADTFFPKGGPIPLSGTEAGLVGYMDSYLRRTPRSSRPLIRLLVVFTEHGPWVFGPRRVRFTHMSHAERLDALDDMRTSRIYFRRIAFLSMRTMLTMGYLANDEVASRMRMVVDTEPFGLPASGAAALATA